MSITCPITRNIVRDITRPIIKNFELSELTTPPLDSQPAPLWAMGTYPLLSSYTGDAFDEGDDSGRTVITKLYDQTENGTPAYDLYQNNANSQPTKDVTHDGLDALAEGIDSNTSLRPENSWTNIAASDWVVMFTVKPGSLRNNQSLMGQIQNPSFDGFQINFTNGSGELSYSYGNADQRAANATTTGITPFLDTAFTTTFAFKFIEGGTSKLWINGQEVWSQASAWTKQPLYKNYTVLRDWTDGNQMLGGLAAFVVWADDNVTLPTDAEIVSISNNLIISSNNASKLYSLDGETPAVINNGVLAS